MKIEPVEEISSRVWIKCGSLIFLTCQTSCLILLMRVSRSVQNSELYSASTVVVCSEFLKLLLSTILIFYQEVKLNVVFHQSIIKVQYNDMIQILIPSTLYIVQNNLLYFAISHLNAVLYQILYQSKIFTTAMFMILLLNHHLRSTQWFSLLLLSTGIILTQLPSLGQSTSSSEFHSNLYGLLAILLASVTSGFAGVYLEKIFKGTSTSIWMRNLQLGLLGVPIGLFGVFINDASKVKTLGFFYGYTPIVWIVVILQAFGGLAIAFVMRYADNILKGFSMGLSMILSSLISYFLFDDFTPNM
ncbi:LOW QUALITY PROTEIN: putative sugar transporter [Schistosoma mansoni]|uniref:putative sugar transporter n=1 Tax=Schistosoma mansoni TaxID=6183 RepID=UPI00022DCA49|nr:LOW QUALITY PROTEIN: putative sugar transporter [Schistosoma mansoni]|eukprot:XP_018654928.1 LOW QUALITY PROTEIN: putative sugar transporter [Schistosoma mansoni]